MNWSKREKWMTAIVIIAVIFAIWSFFSHQLSDSTDVVFSDEFLEVESRNPPVEEKTEDVAEKIFIDVKGAVQSPGVYEMETGERVIDAIEKAGGLTEHADENQINLAMLIKDEMVVYVPKLGEESYQFQRSSDEEGKIAINSATADELQRLSGIGPAKAAAIIAYREEHGPFKRAEDLLNVSGIGEKSLEKIKNDIIID